jgi:small subunit ribosomal protein S14
MAKKSSVEKNNRRKRMVANDFEKRAALKKAIMDKTIPLAERFALTLKLAQLRRNGAKVRIRNRCEFTGRARGYYRKFKLSRICLRQLAGKGLLPGVVKSSW